MNKIVLSLLIALMATSFFAENANAQPWWTSELPKVLKIPGVGNLTKKSAFEVVKIAEGFLPCKWTTGWDKRWWMAVHADGTRRYNNIRACRSAYEAASYFYAEDCDCRSWLRHTNGAIEDICGSPWAKRCYSEVLEDHGKIVRIELLDYHPLSQ